VTKIDLLDHGYCRLVSYTQPAPIGLGQRQPQRWTGDLEIVRAARTSYDADWQGATASVHEQQHKDAKLIRRLWKDRHTSPFEAMTFTFEVQAPIFVFRQWHRHRTQSYSEVSARYTELPDLFYVPKAEHLGQQSTTNKQGTERTAEWTERWAGDQREYIGAGCSGAFETYKGLLKAGVSREQARIVLPVATYSRMYATANLLNWFRFIGLRSDPHAQYEIRVYSDAILELIKPICPVAVSAFEQTRSAE
jgi:thymidylate synthase (FAD)